MSRTIRFHPGLATDLAGAVIWYRNNRPGLETDFLRAFEATSAAIERNPLQYQIVGRSMRRASLHGFPYAVMYVVSDQEIMIVGCRHHRRDPVEWRKRLR